MVATHYDADHIAGLIPLVEEYISHIQEVWVHRPPELDDYHNFSLVLRNEQASRILNERLALVEKEILKDFTEKLDERFPYVFESIRQLKTFLGYLPEEKVREVFSGYSPKNWPEIKVLGPTKNFYDELFPEDKRFEELIFEELESYEKYAIQQESIRQINLKEPHKKPCQYLKDDKSAKITPTNKASIIFALDCAEKRLLFTGDAGIKSFKTIPNWKRELRNLFWLKIPHHGSDNNMSKELIDLMSPEYADSTGSHHQDEPVLQCISQNPRAKRQARSTKYGGNLVFNF
ncbi:hypothetical protein [Flagellimonas sp.]|uniref:hypothetical protein n=1 Tax=Flagellimonas sp. TaxID=2058762 RepID=UPI003B501A32